MRTRLFLSAAAATLSLCLASAQAQNAPRDKGGEAATKQNESTANPTRPDEPKATPPQQQQRQGARGGGRERSEARDAGEAAKQGESAEKADKTDKPGRQGAAKKSEKQGAADEQGGPAERGAQGPEGARGQKGARQEQTTEPTRQGARETGAQERTGEARSGAENRPGPGATDERRAGRDDDVRGERGQRAGTPERRGESEFAPGDQRTRGAFDRTERGARDGREASGIGRDAQGGRVRIGAREQGQIRQMIERRGGRRLAPNAFDLRVGVVAPPNVLFEPLPPDVIAIAPQFRGYNYAMVGDDIAIIDPSSREVVSVLDEGGPPAVYGYEEREGYRGGSAGRDRYGAMREERGERGDMRRERRGEAYGYAPRVRLDTRQERALYRGVMSEARQNLRQVCVRVGERVPESVDIEPVPRSIAAEAPDVERYDYFVLNDQVVLVDPDNRVVVDIIPAPR